MSDVQASGGGLVYEDRLPLAWRLLGPDPGPFDLAHLYEAALTRLNALLAVGDTSPGEPLEEAPARAQDLIRLEARLNLLLAAVGELLALQRPVPPARAVRLAGSWLEWDDPSPPQPGQTVAVGLYLNPCVPDPVTLPARVEATTALSESTARVRASLAEAPVTVRNALEKLIFRYHRRSIAEHRKAQAGRPL